MNDRQRTQLAAYAAEADKISEDWQIERWISRVTTFLAEAMGADEADRFRSIDAHAIFSELALKLGHIEGLLAKGADEPTTAAANSSNRQGEEPEPIASNTRKRGLRCTRARR